MPRTQDVAKRTRHCKTLGRVHKCSHNPGGRLSSKSQEKLEVAFEAPTNPETSFDPTGCLLSLDVGSLGTAFQDLKIFEVMFESAEIPKPQETRLIYPRRWNHPPETPKP